MSVVAGSRAPLSSLPAAAVSVEVDSELVGLSLLHPTAMSTAATATTLIHRRPSPAASAMRPRVSGLGDAGSGRATKGSTPQPTGIAIPNETAVLIPNDILREAAPSGRVPGWVGKPGCNGGRRASTAHTDARRLLLTTGVRGALRFGVDVRETPYAMHGPTPRVSAKRPSNHKPRDRGFRGHDVLSARAAGSYSPGSRRVDRRAGPGPFNHQRVRTDRDAAPTGRL